MKQMVEEILARDQEKDDERKKQATNSPQAPIHSPPSSTPLVPTGIRRPNYQREQQQKRLSPLYQKSSLKDEASHKNEGGNKEKKHPDWEIGEKEANSHRESVSMQRLSLSQAHGLSTARRRQRPERIGRLRNGVEIWFFAGLHPRVAQALQVSGTTCTAVGIITCPAPLKGPVFSAAMLLEDQPEIEREILTGAEGIQLRLGGDDPDHLRTLLRELFMRLNRAGLKRVSIHFSKQPTSLLEKVLPAGEQGAAVLFEGMSEGECWAMLQRGWETIPDSDLHFRVDQSALLLRGDLGVIESVIKVIQREIDSLG